MTILASERLVLSPHDPKIDILAHLTDPIVMRHIGAGAMTTNQVADYIRRYAALWETAGFGGWTVRRVEDQSVLGNIFLKRLRELPEIEVGYSFARTAWGHGYATEALQRVIKFAHEERQISRVVALVRPVNIRSSAVLTRCGFALESTIPLRAKMLELYSIAL
jgi:[ribosomal protein S5]-alanine N-acetyltransferase